MDSMVAAIQQALASQGMWAGVSARAGRWLPAACRQLR
jgi:hypothetical protein